MSNMKTKSKKVIAPMKIKAEKTENNELKELCCYVDDRVALMQQVFLTIKPKKLKSMVPDCLKDLDINEIKELCLDEVLGISTKRLKSIIQGTQCPSDTNSDSDVDEIIEHISLDEISSDDSVTFMSDEERNKNKPENKEMTVLELVELQARARAIRSQLALEPVKKEALDSDSEVRDGNTKTLKKSVSKEQMTHNENVDKAQPGPSIKTKIKNYRTKNNKSLTDTITVARESIEGSPKINSNDSTSNENNVFVENDAENRTMDSEKSLHEHRRSKKKKKLHSKKLLPADNRTRHIELSDRKSLKVNVSFNNLMEKDDDEINLYVSDTEKQELLCDSVNINRKMTNSESDISIVDFNNSPLIISSENENDFKDDKEEGEIDETSVEIKKELIDNAESKNENSIELNKEVNSIENQNVSEKEVQQNEDFENNFSKVEDNVSSDEEAVEENTDWKTRWINSDKVKKVLVTSKLCSNIKKKQKSLQNSKVNKPEVASATDMKKSESEKDSIEITGSVDEFEKLSGHSRENKNTESKDKNDTDLGQAEEKSESK